VLIGKLMSKFAEISDSNHGAHLSSMVSHCRFSQMGHLKSVQHHAVVPKIGLDFHLLTCQFLRDQ
jgi:hypothetical protein